MGFLIGPIARQWDKTHTVKHIQLHSTRKAVIKESHSVVKNLHILCYCNLCHEVFETEGIFVIYYSLWLQAKFKSTTQQQQQQKKEHTNNSSHFNRNPHDQEYLMRVKHFPTQTDSDFVDYVTDNRPFLPAKICSCDHILIPIKAR